MALESSRRQLAAGLGAPTAPVPAGAGRGSAWRLRLAPLAARRPGWLVGGAVLAGGLLGLLVGTAPRRVLRHGALLAAPALWRVLRAEGERWLHQMIRGPLYASLIKPWAMSALSHRSRRSPPMSPPKAPSYRAPPAAPRGATER